MNTSLLFLTAFLLFTNSSLASQEIEEEKEDQALSDKSSYKSLSPPPSFFNQEQKFTFNRLPQNMPESLLIPRVENGESLIKDPRNFLDVPQSPRKKRSFSIDLNLESASYDIVLKEDVPKSYSVIEKEDCEFYQSFISQRSIPSQGCWNRVRQWFCCFLPERETSERFLPLSSSQKLFAIMQSSEPPKKE